MEGRSSLERQLRAARSELAALERQLEALPEESSGPEPSAIHEIIGESAPLREALRRVELVAPTDATVLIVGETGSGKELFARAVHAQSKRRLRAFVKVNCGALAAGLIESELFGHVKGAFTGASDKRVGRFELAHGGTLLLDEITELPLAAQVKLLRVLQEQELEPVGSTDTVVVDVRVIAATHDDLALAVQAGRFRADLWYRLNVVPIVIPPLRERPADIALLVQAFVAAQAHKLGKPLTGFSPRSLTAIMRHVWPGNVRELQNVVERAAVLASGPVLEVDASLDESAARARRTVTAQASRANMDDMQRAHIQGVLLTTRGVIEGPHGAAAILGMHPNTLRSRMKKLGVRP